MSIPASAAAQAYASAARAVATGGSQSNPADSVAQPAGQGFGDVLREAVEAIGQSAQQADQATVAQVAGKADLVDVVTAVTETELAVQTLVTVRDRVISAYQEILRMPI